MNLSPTGLDNTTSNCWANAGAQLLFLIDEIRKNKTNARDVRNAISIPVGADSAICYILDYIEKGYYQGLFELVREEYFVCKNCGFKSAPKTSITYHSDFPSVGMRFIPDFSCFDAEAKDRCGKMGDTVAYTALKSSSKYILMQTKGWMGDSTTFEWKGDAARKPIVYILLGYCVYTGSHYYTICRYPDGTIYRIDDESISRVNSFIDRDKAVIYLYVRQV